MKIKNFEIPRIWEIIINLALFSGLIYFLILSPLTDPIRDFWQLYFGKNWTFSSVKIGNLGKTVDDSRIDKTVVLLDKSSTPNSYLIFGPYQTLINGKYEVTFRLKSDKKTKGSLIKIETSKNEGSIIFSERLISDKDFLKANEYQDFSLDLNTEGGRGFEYRILYLKGTVFVDTIKVKVIKRDWRGFINNFPRNFKKLF